MPDFQQHLLRAKQNEVLARELPKVDGFYVDWAITVLFYSALHYIDAYLAGKNKHPRNHQVRDEEVEANGAISDIFEDYRRLKDMSRSAPYQIADYPVAKFDYASSRLEKIKKHLGV